MHFNFFAKKPKNFFAIKFKLQRKNFGNFVNSNDNDNDNSNNTNKISLGNFKVKNKSNRDFKKSSLFFLVNNENLKIKKIKKENSQENNSDLNKNYKQKLPFGFITKLKKIKIKKFLLLLKQIIKKIIEIYLITFIIYILYHNPTIKKILEKVKHDSSKEFTKLIKQLYLPDLEKTVNIILCDLIEEPRFGNAINNLLVLLYCDQYFMTNSRNLIWELLSIYLRDPYYGAYFNNYLIEFLLEENLESKGKKFFFNFIQREEVYKFILDFFIKVVEHDYFSYCISYVLHLYSMQFTIEGNKGKKIFTMVDKNIKREDLIFRVASINFVGSQVPEKRQNEFNYYERLVKLGHVKTGDTSEYFTVNRLDLEDEDLVNDILEGKKDTYDILLDNKLTIDHNELNDGRYEDFDWENIIKFKRKDDYFDVIYFERNDDLNNGDDDDDEK